MPKGKNLIGAWAFLIGLILAVIFGFIPYGIWLSWLLVILGIVVGLLNIVDEEVQPFLMAGAILVIVSYFGMSVFSATKLGTAFLENILGNVLTLFVPATIIVALKSVFQLAKS